MSEQTPEKDHRQVHRPHDGASECVCGNWVGPMTTLPLSDPRSFAAHIAVEVLTDHADREVAHEGYTIAVERILAHAAEHATPPGSSS